MLPQSPTGEWLGGWHPAHSVHQNRCPVAECHLAKGRGKLHLAQKCSLLSKPCMRVCIFIDGPLRIHLPREGAFYKFIKTPQRLPLALIPKAGYQNKWFGQDSVYTKNQKVFFRSWAGSGGWAEGRRETKMGNGWERWREEERRVGGQCTNDTPGWHPQSWVWLHLRSFLIPHGLSFLMGAKMLWNAHAYWWTLLSSPLSQGLLTGSLNCTPNLKSMQICALFYGGSSQH